MASQSPDQSSASVDRVAVATKHPGVFMETSELEAETGTKMMSKDFETTSKSNPVERPSPSTRRRNRREASTKKPIEPPKNEPANPPKAEEVETTDRAEETVADASKNEKLYAETIEKKDVEVKIEPIKESPTKDGEVEVAATLKVDTEVKKEKQTKDAEDANETNEHDEAEEKAETSTIRRSKRREQLMQQKLEKEMQEAEAQNQEGELARDDYVFENANEMDMEAGESVDKFDMESVGSELDSLESGSVVMKNETIQRGNRRNNKKGGKSKTRGKAIATNSRGKSRRAIFKKSSTKAPSAVARAVASDRIYYKGQYLTKGDIVSVVDIDGGVFYAQLKGFLCDQYCEKSGVITWLLPTINSPPPEEGFDPSTYVIGPEEELPRRLEHFTFVMHAPDNYFYYSNAPYPTESVSRDHEYLVTRFGPKVRLFKDGKTSYA